MSSSGSCCSRDRNRRAATVNFVATAVIVVALTLPTAVEAQTSQTSDVTYPYLGCYKDEPHRAMSHFLNPKPLTLESCAEECIDLGHAYIGLQYGQECFCGDEYDLYGEVVDDSDSDRSCDMRLSAQPETEAGGHWALSVYDVSSVSSAEAAALRASSAQISYSSSGPSSSGTGNSGGSAHLDGTSDVSTDGESNDSESSSHLDGTSDVSTDGESTDSVPSGERAFTVVNQCSQTIRVGFTGGRITFGDGTDPADKDNCDNWGSSAVYNEGPMGIGCFWEYPPESSGNTDRMLAPGESFHYPLYETDSDVRWSGTIWGSTGCDLIDGCTTGVCYSPDTNHVCPSYVGPGGPTTKAEFTLSDTYKDYYDVSSIDGVNLPMMIEPNDPVFPTLDETNAQHIKKYQCGSPGSPSAHLDTLADCEWSFETHVDMMDEDMSQFLRLVYPDDYDNPILCESDDDCDGLICGVHPKRWANGAYKGGVEQGSCGEHVAWVSAGGACAGGWEVDVFPDAFPFYCGETVTNGMRANMYGCSSGDWAHSGYTPGATSSSCGCPDWEGDPYNLMAPPISDCQGVNPEWVELAMPWAAHLKRACPTAYTFPYDDQTSTFTCYDGEGPGSSDSYINTQSYTITFCPGDTESAMFP